MYINLYQCIYIHIYQYINEYTIISIYTKHYFYEDYHEDDEITITAGATQALYTAIAAFIKENDEVILFTPAYDCYQPAIEICGGKPVFFQLKAPDYGVNWEEVKKLINQKTRMIVINTPHNPTGSILSKNASLGASQIPTVRSP